MYVMSKQFMEICMNKYIKIKRRQIRDSVFHVFTLIFESQALSALPLTCTAERLSQLQ